MLKQESTSRAHAKLVLPLRARAAVNSSLLLDCVSGRDTGKYLARFEAMQHWNAEQFRDYNRQRLRELLIHCWDKVPFYRERFRQAGLSREDLETDQEILRRLPPLTKSDVRVHSAEMRAADGPRMIPCSTSGSTGQPVKIWFDADSAACARAVQRRAFRWYGVEPYEPRIMLLSAPLTGWKRLRHRIIDGLTGRRLFTFHDLNDEQLYRVAHAIRRHRPSFVTAYPSVLHEFCNFCVRNGLNFKDESIRLLHTQSEMLHPFQRESFEKVFGAVPVLNEYGCVEIGAMAYSCPDGTMHVSHGHVILEVVDDQYQPVPEGQLGRILLTPLHAKGMPFVRYEIGDEGALSTAVCPCGRMAGSAALSQLSGRIFERIYGSNGKTFSAGLMHFLVRCANTQNGLREYLAVQRRKGELHVLIVPSDSYDAEFPERLRVEAQRVFGPGISLSTELVDRIPKEKRTKRSYFVSEMTDATAHQGQPDAQ